MVTLRDRWHEIRSVSLEGGALHWTAVVAIAYFVLSFWLNELLTVLPTMMRTRPGYAAASLALIALTGTLLGINATLVARHIRFRSAVTHGALAAVGTTSGLIGAACPACAVGLFPIIAGSLGSTFSLAALPFFGLEFGLLAVLLLGASTWLLTSEAKACPIPPSSVIHKVHKLHGKRKGTRR